MLLIRRALRRAQRRYLPLVRPGRVSEAMRDFWGVGQRGVVQIVLRQALPRWPISATLIEAAGELADLRAGAAAGLAAGVPVGLIRPFEEEIAEASEAVWRIADRVTAAAAQRVDERLLAPALDLEAEKLTTLVLAIRQAREGLAHVTLCSPATRQVEQVARRLRALDEATKAVAILPGS